MVAFNVVSSFDRSLCREGKMRQDTLSYRVNHKIDLTEDEVYAVVAVIGDHCQQKTKDKLCRRLALVSLMPNYGIYDRVIISPRASYCAGQSYPDEIRTVRRLILEG